MDDIFFYIQTEPIGETVIFEDCENGVVLEHTVAEPNPFNLNDCSPSQFV